MEEKVTTGPYLSDFMNRLHQKSRDEMAKSREQGLEQGLEQGIEAGIEQGREGGLERGRADALRTAIRQVFAARGLLLNSKQEARLNSCHDPDILGEWHLRALTATSAINMFRSE